MRTLILLLVLLAPGLTQANHGNGNTRGWSSASFVSEGPFKIKVFINGRAVNYRPQHQVNQIRLKPGNHRVRVVAYGPRRTKETRDVLSIRPRRANQFAVRSAGRRGGLYLDPIVVDHTRNRRGRLHDAPPTRGHAVDFCEDARYFNVDRLINQMNCEPFDGRKVQLAKNAIRYTSIFAYDLQYLLEQLTFDDSKLELATFAYTRVCNVEEYYLVFDAFSFQSSVRRLKRATGYH